MLKTIEYKDAHGKTQTAAYLTNHSVYELSGQRERFCQLMAQGKDAIDAYCEAYSVALDPSNEAGVSRTVKRMCNETAIVLRIADLKKPVLRKLARKIEYTVLDALAECQIAWDLAHVQGDVKGMLKAVELKARLQKLLSEEINVNHKHGLLDDVATEVLLEMKKEIEVRRERQKKIAASVTVEGTLVGDTPHGPSSGTPTRVPSEAVPN